MEKFTREDYMKQRNVISVEECEKIYGMLIDALVPGDEDCEELFSDLILSMKKYATIRADWFIELDLKGRQEIDSHRTSLHDIVISGCNALARLQSKLGKSNEWRELLGDERKRIGDFACYVVFIYSINSR